MPRCMVGGALWARPRRNLRWGLVSRLGIDTILLMSGLEIWLRVTALVFPAALIGLLGPAEGIERWLLVSTNLEQLADGLRWR